MSAPRLTQRGKRRTCDKAESVTSIWRGKKMRCSSLRFREADFPAELEVSQQASYGWMNADEKLFSIILERRKLGRAACRLPINATGRNGRFWCKTVVRRADDHAGSESLVDIAVVPEGEGAGLSACIVDHAAARPPRSRARSRRRAPVPSERENGRRASSRARLVLRRLKGSGAQILAIERQDVESNS